MLRSRSRRRLLAMVLVGALVAAVTGLAASWLYAPAVGWAAAAAVFGLDAWIHIWPCDAEHTRAHATREDPSRAETDVLVLVANLASLAAIVVMLARADHLHGTTRELLAGGAVLCVALSWLLVHTLYTLRYALVYYTAPTGGIDFNQDDPPRYQDFAYLAFTLGMTFQVSDTNLTTAAIRSTALRHALLSYVFGSVILATTINAVVTITTAG